MLEPFAVNQETWQEWLVVGGYLALLLVVVIGVFWDKR
jgi:hypothetical protein